jgi:hypothetical protein
MKCQYEDGQCIQKVGDNGTGLCWMHYRLLIKEMDK